MGRMLKTVMMALVVATVGLALNAEAQCAKKKSLSFRNEDFYTADGKFDVEKGKDAIIALCEYHGYPVFPEFRKNLWVSDYGTGQFTKLGLAAYMFMNNVEDLYMQMDLFLLPDQMLPEHWHLAGDGNPVKMEGWLVRHGKSYVVGVGENNLADYPDVRIPKCHNGGKTKTKHVTPARTGQFVCLAEAKSRHWQFGGKEGAIMTESANVHTDSGVRHSDKAVNDQFLGK